MVLFKSPHAMLVMVIRHAVQFPHPVTGLPDPERGVKRLAAEFGIAGPEYQWTNPETGESISRAEISGHFFDSDEAAERLNWSPEEKDAVEGHLIRKCQELPAMIQRVEAVHVPAGKPWASFDEATAEQAVEYATALNLVPETLRYERENAERPFVIAALEGKLAELPEEEQSKAKSKRALGPDALKVEKAHMGIGKAPDVTEGGIFKGSIVL